MAHFACNALKQIQLVRRKCGAQKIIEFPTDTNSDS
jgi:hypothetical protein